MIGLDKLRRNARELAEDPTPIRERVPIKETRAVYEWQLRRKVSYRTVREIRRLVIPDPWLRFDTADDERVCPECGPLDGREWPERSPAPARVPVHVNCRCAINQAAMRYKVRFVVEYRRERVVRYDKVREHVGWEKVTTGYEWKITGWE